MFKNDWHRFKLSKITWNETKCSFIKRLDKAGSLWQGLPLETEAFRIFHGGNSTFINSFDKTKFLKLEETQKTLMT